MLDIVWQVVAAALLAGLDKNHQARMRNPLRVQRADSGKAGEHGVAVVSGAAPEKLVALEHGIPWAEAVAPCRHFGLLIEMPIEQYAIGIIARYIDQNQWRAFFQLDHFKVQATDRLLRRPLFKMCDHLIHVAVLPPLFIE